MAQVNGTLELSALELGRGIGSLAGSLSRSGVRNFFARLGTGFPEELLDHAAFTAQLDLASGLAGDIPPLSVDLAVAVRTDVFDAVTKAAALLSTFADLVESLDDVGTELGALAPLAGTSALPDITPQQVTDFASGFQTKVIDFVLAQFIEEHAMAAMAPLRFLGIIEVTDHPGDPGDPASPPYTERTVHAERVLDLISSPNDFFRSRFDWGDPSFDGEFLLSELRTYLAEFRFDPSLEASPLQLTAGPLFLEPNLSASPRGLDLTMRRRISSGLGLAFPVFRGWTVEVDTFGSFPAGLKALIQPPFAIEITPALPDTEIEGQLVAALVNTHEPRSPIFTLPGGAGLLVGETRAEVALEATWDAAAGKATGDFAASLALRDALVGISGGDGFTEALLPEEGLAAHFDLELGYSSARGLFLQGNVGLELYLHVHEQLGVIALDAISVALRIADGKLELSGGADFVVAFGPAELAVQGLGISLLFTPTAGNLGPVDLAPGVKPPTGIGLSLDLPPVAGGGFLALDFESGEYAGVVQLAVAETFDIQAVGLVAELPSGDFSIMAIGSVEFTPPIQLFAGFALGGVGALVGIHRAMNADALRAGVKEGNLDAILFPQDPIRNASRIINSLAKFFPPTQDTYVFGALGLITWGAGGFFELKVGVALEVPHHLKLLVAAILNISLSPGRGEVLRLRADVLGFFDFDSGEVSIDGSLFDSQVAGFLVSGDSVFRNKSTRGFIMSAGGFHPAFDPPADLAQLERLAIAFAAGPVKLRVEGYFAITSNTVQAGARAELRARAAGFGLEGSMSVDVLFQFDPFRVRVDFSARVAIKAGGSTIMSLSLNATLEGFTPTKISGRVSFKILFVRIRIPVSLSFGRKSERTFETVDVLNELLPALEEPRNWASDLDRANSQAVTLREPDPAPGDGFLVHPLAPLGVRQQLVPLDIEIELYKSARPQGHREFSIVRVELGSDTRVVEVPADRRVTLEDKFAPAQYFEYTDDEKLSAPSFEEMSSGVRITTTELEFGSDEDVAQRVMQYEETVLDREQDEWIKRAFETRYTMLLELLLVLAAASAQGKQLRALRPAEFYPRGQKVTVKPQRYVIAKRGDGALEVATDIPGTADSGTTHAKATVLLNKHEQANHGFLFRNPNQYGVVGLHELQEAS